MLSRYRLNTLPGSFAVSALTIGTPAKSLRSSGLDTSVPHWTVQCMSGQMHCKEWLTSCFSEASSLLVSRSASSPVWQLASLEQVRGLQACLLRPLSIRVSQVPEAEEAQRPLSLSYLSPT